MSCFRRFCAWAEITKNSSAKALAAVRVRLTGTKYRLLGAALDGAAASSASMGAGVGNGGFINKYVFAFMQALVQKSFACSKAVGIYRHAHQQCRPRVCMLLYLCFLASACTFQYYRGCLTGIFSLYLARALLPEKHKQHL